VQIAGRNSYAAGDLVNAGRNSGLDSRFSDYVARLQFSPSANLSFIGRGRFDERTLDVKRVEATVNARVGRLSGSATYARFAPQPDVGYPNRREGLTGSARLQLSEHWFASGSVLFDLSRHLEERQRLPAGKKGNRFAVASTSIGLGYMDECTIFTVNYTSTPKDGVFGAKADNRSIMMRLELRTLGEIGVTQALGNEGGLGGLFQ